MKLNTKIIAASAGGLSTTAMALAAVFIPHWESGGRMDTTVRQQSIDPPGVYTVCDGITNLDPDYSWIKPGMVVSEVWCAEAFKKILPNYVAPVAACIKNFDMIPPHRQVALVSFAYNVGPAALCGDKHHSGLIAREINAGNTVAACKAMGQFIKANGVVLKGLQNRRFDPKWGEITWCLRED